MADQRNAIQQLSAAGIGAVIGAGLGGDSNTVKQSAQMAVRTEQFNRQLHPDEKQRIEELAQGDEEKQKRLEAAACALVHCSAQIPKDAPDYAEVYAKAKALEDLGNQAEFASERALLAKQLAHYDPLDSVSGYRRQLFQYNEVQRGLDAVDRADTQYGVSTRAGGLAQATGGVAATAFGVGLCESGIGCVAGVPVAAYGVDNAVAGARAVYSGKNHATVGAKALADLTGINPETAELIYSSPSMVFGIKPIAMGASKATGAMANEVARIGGDVKYVAAELGKDVKAVNSYLNDKVTKFGVNVQNSQALTNINNTIPKEYKAAFGINAITGGAVESLYYLEGSKNITKDNLASSTIKVGTNAVYDSLVHKLNPIHGVAADTVKGIVIDEKSITNSISGSLQSSGISSFIEGGADRLNVPPTMGRFISSFGNKYIEYKEESEPKGEGK